MFEPGAEVLWYQEGRRCYGTVANVKGDRVIIQRYDEDGKPTPFLEDINEIYVRDADDPDDPEN